LSKQKSQEQLKMLRCLTLPSHQRNGSTKASLQKEAAHLGLKGRSLMNKTELGRALALAKAEISNAEKSVKTTRKTTSPSFTAT
jgi:hypothetical protein